MNESLIHHRLNEIARQRIAMGAGRRKRRSGSKRMTLRRDVINKVARKRMALGAGRRRSGSKRRVVKRRRGGVMAGRRRSGSKRRVVRRRGGVIAGRRRGGVIAGRRRSGSKRMTHRRRGGVLVGGRKRCKGSKKSRCEHYRTTGSKRKCYRNHCYGGDAYGGCPDDMAHALPYGMGGRRRRSSKRMKRGGSKRTTNPWIAHVKRYAKQHHMSYPEAMIRARSSYRR